MEAVDSQTTLVASFHIGDMLFGIDALRVEEAIKVVDITAVPHAPEHIPGVINLRGRIVTVVNLAKKLGMPESPISESSRFIIISWHDEYIGFLVDSVSDVVAVDALSVQPPPSNVKGMQGANFEGVQQIDAGLLIILKVSAVLDG